MMTLTQFWLALSAHPPLLFVTCCTLAAVVVNGWTDAPTAIVTCVSTNALSLKKAVIMGVVMNFLGILATTVTGSKVAETVFHAADFGGNPKFAFAALCGALLSVVVWAATAWWFGIPTSESHGLIAALAGAASALGGQRFPLRPWLIIFLGLFCSLFFSALLSYWAARKLRPLAPSPFFRRAQIGIAAMMALLHGAQDGQKFMSIFLLGISFVQGAHQHNTIPLWLVIACAVAMAGGTAMGGRRIIQKVGRDMMPLSPQEGLASDVGASLCLLGCTMGGLPVSTTHTKTAAMMGAGSLVNLSRPIATQLLAAWLFTFPACGLLGFFFTMQLLLL